MSPTTKATAPKKRSLLVPIAILAVLVLAVAGGGGWFLFGRNTDPTRRAEQLLQQGDARGALIELRNAVRAAPNSADAHMRLARLQMQLADPVAAEKEFKAARDLGADRWTVIPLLGQVYMAQSRFRDVLTEVPTDGPTEEATAKNLMLRSMAQVALSDIPAAKASLAEAEKRAPKNTEVLLTSARLAFALKDFATAEAKADEALKIDPDVVDGLLIRGQILAARGDKAGAMAMTDRALVLQPSSSAARLDRANQLIQEGQDAKAQADVAAVLKVQPRNAGATYLNGVLLVRAGKYAEAQTELQKLEPVIQRFPRAVYFQALAAANLGQQEIAIDLANRYVARMPADADGVRLVARTELTAQRPELAVAALSKAVAGGQGDAQTLDLLGRSYAMMGRTTDAVETFRRASAAAPDDATILMHLASSQMQQGSPGSAASALERSLEIAPRAPNAAEALVAAELSAGDMDKAEAALGRLKAQSGETEAYGILSGMVKLGRLDLEGGRVAFANTLKQFPDSFNAKLNLAKVLILQGRRPEGEALLKEVLAKDPANIPALNTAVQLAAQQASYPQAIQLVEAARAAAPKNLAFTAMLADLMVRSGDPRRAVAILQAMRNTEELQPILLAALARAQAAADMNEEAKNTYRDLIRLSPNDLDARRANAELLLRLGQTDAAKEALAQTLVQAPGNIGVMESMIALEVRANGVEAGLKMADDLRAVPSNLPNSAVLKGDTLMNAQRFPDAAAAFLAEFKMTPTAPLLLRMSNALVASGKNDDATRALRDWQKADQADPDIAQMLSLLDIAANRIDEAERNLNIVLAKRPADPVAMNNLAWVYQRKNDPRARTLAQRAYLQAPTPETADTLGWIMVGLGDAKTALPLLQQAAQQRTTDPAVRYHLAVALKDTAQKDDAIKVLQTIVNAPTPFEEQAAARQLLSDLQKP